MQSLLITLLACSLIAIASAGDFNNDFDITWGDGRGKIHNNGQLLSLSLDKASGSGFQSKHEYLFGKIDMQLKLVAGNSAGTVTAYHLSSQGPTHDEIDFEFLGNLSEDPYTLHTNVFAQGKGNREQQFHLLVRSHKGLPHLLHSLEPKAHNVSPLKFFYYKSLCNHLNTLKCSTFIYYSFSFSVDGIPIRDFKNQESRGVAFPKNQPMRIYSSLWNADDWATRGGQIKTDWTQGPFTASYQNFNANACVFSSGASSCSSKNSARSSANNAWLNQELDATSQERMRWVQKNYMIYNYCTDLKRFPQGLPPECSVA